MELKIRGLRAGYGALEIVHGIDLTVGTGQFVAVVGPNGAGKTTTLRSAMSMIAARSGSVSLDSQDVTGLPTHVLVAKHGMVFVPEGRHLFPDFTVRETLELASKIKVARPRTMTPQDALDLFPSLAKRFRSPAGKLSGGEQQMLAVARALMLAPAALLLDEPSIGLAPRVVREVIRIVAEQSETGLAVLVVEQNIASVADVADYAYVIEHGSVVRSGPGSDILNVADLRETYLER